MPSYHSASKLRAIKAASNRLAAHAQWIPNNRYTRYNPHIYNYRAPRFIGPLPKKINLRRTNKRLKAADKPWWEHPEALNETPLITKRDKGTLILTRPTAAHVVHPLTNYLRTRERVPGSHQALRKSAHVKYMMDNLYSNSNRVWKPHVMKKKR